MVNDKTDKGLDFTAEIEKFYDEFPEHRGVVFIVNPNEHDSIEDFLIDTPEFAKKLAEYQDIEKIKEKGAPEEFIQSFKDRGFVLDIDYIDICYNRGSYCHEAFDIVDLLDALQEKRNCSFLSLVAVAKETKPLKIRLLDAFNKNPFKDSYSKEIAQKASFYHEIGHALYNQKNADKLIDYFFRDTDKQFAHETEAAAECYSIIRLTQEYGIEHPDIERIFAERTFDRLQDPDSRYNFLPVMHEVARLAKTGELDNLTAQESFNLAGKITQEKVITRKQSKQVSRFLGSAYDSLSSNKDIANSVRNFSASIANIKEPIVLNDAQYILQCLEDVTSNNPHIQKQVKKMWDALKSNEVVQEKGLLQQHWRATKLKVEPRKTIAMHLKGLF